MFSGHWWVILTGHRLITTRALRTRLRVHTAQGHLSSWCRGRGRPLLHHHHHRLERRFQGQSALPTRMANRHSLTTTTLSCSLPSSDLWWRHERQQPQLGRWLRRTETTRLTTRTTRLWRRFKGLSPWRSLSVASGGQASLTTRKNSWRTCPRRVRQLLEQRQPWLRQQVGREVNFFEWSNYLQPTP